MSTNKSTVTVEQLQGWADDSPFIAFCQMTVESVDAEKGIVEMKMSLIDALARGGAQRMFHGGPVASLIDKAWMLVGRTVGHRAEPLTIARPPVATFNPIFTGQP